jgi:hypothetical protein
MHIYWTSVILIALLLLIALIRVARKNAYPESFNMPLGAALRLNAWAIAAIAVSFAARWCLKQPDWSPGLRVALALAPLLPGALYARAILHWVRGLDELQRRIQSEACLFAAAGMGLVFMAFDLLQLTGLPPLHWGWEGAFALTFIFWMLGALRSNRLYQ